MSRFSGKCDFYDHLCIYCNNENDIERILSISDIFIITEDWKEHKLNIKTIKDATKYYPYLISMGVFSKDKHSIVLSKESFIDREERESLQFDIDYVLKYWRKCKREKKDFDKDVCYEKLHWCSTGGNYLKEIIERVAENGNKADFTDIHKPTWERYRKNWFDEMVRVGYSEYEAFTWCYNEFIPSEEKISERLKKYENQN